MCVYYVFEGGMDRGAGGGRRRARDITRNESGLERERDEYDGGEGIEAPGEIFCVCGVCVGMFGCEKIMRRGGRGRVTA